MDLVGYKTLWSNLNALKFLLTSDIWFNSKNLYRKSQNNNVPVFTNTFKLSIVQFSLEMKLFLCPYVQSLGSIVQSEKLFDFREFAVEHWSFISENALIKLTEQLKNRKHSNLDWNA